MGDPSRHWRQQGIVPSEVLSSLAITGIGVGAIGSNTFRALAKMGVENIRVFDPDSIENHNLPNQHFRVRDIGRPKVDAFAEIVGEETGVEISTHKEAFKDQVLMPGIIISAVDSMETRTAIWQRVRMKPNAHFYIEARMGAQTGRIYSFIPTLPRVVSWYEEHMLYSDEEAQELPCTEQAIIYNTYMIAALIAHLVTEFAMGKQSPWETIFDFVTRSFLTYP